MNLRTIPASRPISDNPGREALLFWIRAHAPDFRIRKARLEDGRRACLATLTFRGEEIAIESVEDDKTDPDEAVVQRSSWILQQRLGLRTHLALAERTKLEQAVVKARQHGDAEQAERLGLELALANEGYTRRAPIRARWER